VADALEGAPIRRVLVLHGIWNTRQWLLPLAWRLRRGGLQVDSLSYPSLAGAEAVLPRLLDRLRHGRFDGVVGHSLGGLLALEAVRRLHGLPVRRVVCLGSPLCGSATARALAAASWRRRLLGRSANLLVEGVAPWRSLVEVGLVAGTRPRGVGRWVTDLGPDSDGTVAYAETDLPGLAARCRVPASHAGLLWSAPAAGQVLAFLRDGRFRA
jgi:pimeloyl-ACP methyl ester carboxylesterase